MPIKGHPAWNKGLRGLQPWHNTSGLSRKAPFKGRKHTVESRRKIGEAQRGKPGHRLGFKCSEETKLKISLGGRGVTGHKRGVPFTKEHRKAMSLARIGKRTGEKNSAWKGGVTPINTKIRNSLDYEEWRTKVFERDLYTCQECKQVGGYLEADHVKPFFLYPQLRFELSNGKTLCKPCHKIKTLEDMKIIIKFRKGGTL